MHFKWRNAVLLFACLIWVMKGSAGVLDLKGAFKPPGKAGLCAVLLRLCCAHHPRSQRRSRHIESPVRGETVRPRWKNYCCLHCLSLRKKNPSETNKNSNKRSIHTVAGTQELLHTALVKSRLWNGLFEEIRLVYWVTAFECLLGPFFFLESNIFPHIPYTYIYFLFTRTTFSQFIFN